LSIGIVKGLDHLHTASQKPIIHGNLKTNNIMLDADFQPRISDFGLYLLLNPAAAQEMLETSAIQGYKAPELIKMRDATRESDIYSLGVIMLEMLAQKEIVNDKLPNARDIHLPASFKDLVLERKISEAFSSELIRQSKNSGKEENLNAYFELATACCNPSPSLRPDTKKILKRLEDIAR
jgi:serine/threonine protein kinase